MKGDRGGGAHDVCAQLRNPFGHAAGDHGAEECKVEKECAMFVAHLAAATCGGRAEEGLEPHAELHETCGRPSMSSCCV